MNKNQYFEILANKMQLKDKNDFLNHFKQKCEILILEKGDELIEYQSNNRRIYFIVQGSFVRNIITSLGEEKTVMFHTESFCEFFKSYDTVYFHKLTNYRVKANEKSVVLSFDFDDVFEFIKSDLQLMQFYLFETEKIFVNIDLFRSFQLGLTSEEYLKWIYENYPFLFQRFASQNIASFMGITNVWLSNLKSKLTF
ncbi:MAG: hypothetical protein C4K58_06700 [Flavobacteriaceae bacterium]|nr:MAG: hypothetical protein C4K58_06700 [Flavobacteriaceae bacterium]